MHINELFFDSNDRRGGRIVRNASTCTVVDKKMAGLTRRLGEVEDEVHFPPVEDLSQWPLRVLDHMSSVVSARPSTVGVSASKQQVGFILGKSTR